MAGSRCVFELGVIGAGNMAEGIVAAVVAKGLYPAEQIVVSDSIAERQRMFADRFHVAVTQDNHQLVEQSRRIMLAVKPQKFTEVAAGFADAVTEHHLVISIMAGVSTQRIAAAFGERPARVVRVMPNLAIRVGAGMAGLYANPQATPTDLAETRAIFDAGGATVVVPDEAMIDAVTAVSGSGPAYFYYFVEAIAAGGVACGLSEAEALKLAEHTCLGAARIMLETGQAPADLRGQVTSKGGTTQAAIEYLNGNNVSETIREAVRKAFLRARELGSAKS